MLPYVVGRSFAFHLPPSTVRTWPLLLLVTFGSSAVVAASVTLAAAVAIAAIISAFVASAGSVAGFPPSAVKTALSACALVSSCASFRYHVPFAIR